MPDALQLALDQWRHDNPYRKARERLGMTQEELAASSPKPLRVMTISRCENHSHDSQLSTFLLMARTLGVDSGTLMRLLDRWLQAKPRDLESARAYMVKRHGQLSDRFTELSR